MKNQQEKQNESQGLREVGSNLTGTAVPAKPGHQRDIPIETYRVETDDQKKDRPGYIENTDALISDVPSQNISKESQDGHRTEKGDQL